VRPGDWGVDEGYDRADGRWADAPPATVEAILRSMGAGDKGPEPPEGDVLLVRAGEERAVGGPALLTTEDGAEVEIAATLPPDLPLGYHQLRRLDDDAGGVTSLIVSPGRCRPPDRPSWGWAVQLYALRSRSSWGIGDLADLCALARWTAGDLGGGFVLLNPLHAALPGPPQEASPYFPSTRQFRNPLYLRVEDVPGAASLLPDLEALAAAGRELNGDRRIDRDAAWRLKFAALERLYAAFDGDPGFDAWERAAGAPLEAYATFCALSEEHGRPWQAWPAAYRHPGGPAVAEFRRQRAGRVRFHAWVQWLVDRQLSGAEAWLPVVQDVAIGFDAAGADGWIWQDTIAFDMSVGAPPDEFNTLGQDWGVPPFDPWRLRAAAYRPFVETVRANLRAGGGVRIDHVMGLFRLFWIPRGEGAGAGTYVRYPAPDLLDILALESERAGAFVVGEDLGTVEPGVREELGRRGVLSYRLLWFEDGPPREWPEQALAAVTTHDLPTVAGLWTGRDLEIQRAAGMEPNEEGTAATRARLQTTLGVPDDAPTADVVGATYEVLGAAPCRLLAATVDDALAVEERPNLPGTTDQWPNWSLALPVPLDDLPAQPGPHRIARSLSRDGRQAPATRQ
jgi:4-alpha-glucanotransferase